MRNIIQGISFGDYFFHEILLKKIIQRRSEKQIYLTEKHAKILGKYLLETFNGEINHYFNEERVKIAVAIRLLYWHAKYRSFDLGVLRSVGLNSSFMQDLNNVWLKDSHLEESITIEEIDNQFQRALDAIVIFWQKDNIEKRASTRKEDFINIKKHVNELIKKKNGRALKTFLSNLVDEAKIVNILDTYTRPLCAQYDFYPDALINT